jgi:hypothetical protein
VSTLAKWCVAVACVVLSSAWGRADGGVSVFVCGHSFHQYIDQPLEALAREGGFSGHRNVGKLFVGSSRVLDIWKLPEGKNTARAALEGGKVDVLTLSPHKQVPDEGIDRFVELAVRKNPEIRVLVQVSWSPTLLTQPGPEAWQVPASQYIAILQQQADRLNAQTGRTTVELVPVALAVSALWDQVLAGKVPGVKSMRELFVDEGLHPGPILQNLVAYCWYAAIYRTDPRGMKTLDGKVPAEVNRLLQEIAWKTVTDFSKGKSR